MARARKEAPASQALIDYGQVLDTGLCVPAIRAAVDQWLASGDYPGVTATTRTLLHYWFQTDHRLHDRRLFSYHSSQRLAIETLVYLYEVAHISSQRQMYDSYVHAGRNPRMRGKDAFPLFAGKTAAGRHSPPQMRH